MEEDVEGEAPKQKRQRTSPSPLSPSTTTTTSTPPKLILSQRRKSPTPLSQHHHRFQTKVNSFLIQRDGLKLLVTSNQLLSAIYYTISHINILYICLFTDLLLTAVTIYHFY